MDLSISIANYNTKDLLYNCLLSIFQTTQNMNFEVIVVDNNSQDNSAEMVSRDFPQVILLCNKNNIGFSKANNKAFKISSGRNILLLNSDIVVLKDSLNKMVNFLDKNQNIAIAGCKIKSPQGTARRSCFKFPNLTEHLASQHFLKKVINLDSFSLNYSDWNSGKIKEVDWVSGSCLMIKKKALEQIGLLDERLFIYFEDVDLCLRTKKAGFKVYYFPQVSIIHFGQGSTQQDKGKYEFEWHKSRWIYFKKHHSYLGFTVMRFFTLYGAFSRIISLFFKWILAPKRSRGIKNKLKTNLQIINMGFTFGKG